MADQEVGNVVACSVAGPVIEDVHALTPAAHTAGLLLGCKIEVEAGLQGVRAEHLREVIGQRGYALAIAESSTVEPVRHTRSIKMREPALAATSTSASRVARPAHQVRNLRQNVGIENRVIGEPAEVGWIDGFRIRVFWREGEE